MLVLAVNVGGEQDNKPWLGTPDISTSTDLALEETMVSWSKADTVEESD